MILTILSKDGTCKVLNYDDNSTFVAQTNKDQKFLLSTVATLDNNFESFTTKKDAVGTPIVKTKGCIAEKLPKKIRVRSSSTTSKELENQFIKYFNDPKFILKYGSFKLRSQHAFYKAN